MLKEWRASSYSRLGTTNLLHVLTLPLVPSPLTHTDSIYGYAVHAVLTHSITGRLHASFHAAAASACCCLHVDKPSTAEGGALCTVPGAAECGSAAHNSMAALLCGQGGGQGPHVVVLPGYIVLLRAEKTHAHAARVNACHAVRRRALGTALNNACTTVGCVPANMILAARGRVCLLLCVFAKAE